MMDYVTELRALATSYKRVRPSYAGQDMNLFHYKTFTDSPV